MKRTVSISEMADYCQVTAETIRRWIDSGAIPARRTLGGHRRIEYKDFLEFLEKNNLPIERTEITETKRMLIIAGKGKSTDSLLKNLSELNGEHAVERASDGFDAGHKLVNFQPDLIFFHEEMPSLDIKRVVKLVREDTAIRTSTIVFIPAEKTNGHRAPMKIEGVDTVLADTNDKDTIKKILAS